MASETTTPPQKARTLGELRASDYQPRSIRTEMRDNLIDKIRKGEKLFPGMMGYEETVIPQIENAILSGQDIIFLGERGQAKTRLARSLAQPARRVAADRRRLRDQRRSAGADLAASAATWSPSCGDDTPIDWLPRDRRYGEKLATPDITIADLIGEVDPIKVAEGRYLSDELTIHYGLLPRTNRGIFVLNELPDLAERIQVGLLNIMEERDVQIRGYKVRLPLDLFVVASANPEDYTNRGRIITPLKDRFGSQIRTHYPRDHRARDATSWSRSAASSTTAGIEVIVPEYMREIVAEVTHLARKIARDLAAVRRSACAMSVANYENMRLERAAPRDSAGREAGRAARLGPRSPVQSSTGGKIELESVGELREEKVIEKLMQKAMLDVFNRHFALHEFDGLVLAFDNGLNVEASDVMPALEYVHQLSQVDGMNDAVKKLGVGGNPAAVARAIEIVLEGPAPEPQAQQGRRTPDAVTATDGDEPSAPLLDT